MPGDTFRATVAEDVWVNGQVVDFPAKRTPRAKSSMQNQSTPSRAALISPFVLARPYVLRHLPRLHQLHRSRGKRQGQAHRVHGRRRRGFGAIVGALAGGGEGTAIGALAGGGAGTAGSAFTGNKQIFLPAETLLTFHLENDVHITEQR